MEELKKLKKTILEDYPHLDENDKFKFVCGPKLECFNKCCCDVNIFLTPYDVLRMRKAAGIGSGKFLADYTIIPFDRNLKLPMPLMQLDDSDDKRCHFVDKEKGCTIYGDRPWPCRMYPLGMGSPGELAGEDKKPFYFVMKEDVCKGHDCPKEWSVGEWMADQGVDEYVEFGELYKEISLHPAFANSKFKLTAKQVDLYWIALYDLDKFRRFIFDSSFFDRIVVEPDEVERIRTDDEALLRFGFRWIRMSLFGEKTFKITEQAREKALRIEKPVTKV